MQGMQRNYGVQVIPQSMVPRDSPAEATSYPGPSKVCEGHEGFDFICSAPFFVNTSLNTVDGLHLQISRSLFSDSGNRSLSSAEETQPDGVCNLQVSPPLTEIQRYYLPLVLSPKLPTLHML